MIPRHGGAWITMEKELLRWLAHAYRQGLFVRNSCMRRIYADEPIITGRKLRKYGKLQPRRRRVWRAFF